jgi:multicomponent Na+:H+ antiporter subunit F
MMDELFGVLALVVGATLVVGVWHALRSPTRAEAMMTVQIAGTAAAGSLLLAGPSTIGMAATLDLVIVVAALAAVTAISFVASGRGTRSAARRAGPGGNRSRSLISGRPSWPPPGRSSSSPAPSGSCVFPTSTRACMR